VKVVVGRLEPGLLEGQVDLERQHLLVDPEEEGHGLGPAEQPGHVAADPLGRRHVVVLHGEVGLQQFHHLVVDGVLGEVEELAAVALYFITSVLKMWHNKLERFP